ncbi:hypothetical protein M9H77_09132 [Catharanthus roseus]|uniref:Uncharacterized protein n=1 Tax=Catharanthus roseus TaxID=4058 RepID=A0ACC0BZX3_CATRO|nr:hypothetical protein M9H77_09132 [Catharanthus roseus]
MKRLKRGGKRAKNKSAKKKKNHEVKRETTILDLNTTILMEIFLTLPPIAIIFCKVVCKEWYNLLTQSLFCSLYLKNPPYMHLIHFDFVKGYYPKRYQYEGEAIHLISLKKGSNNSHQEPSICSKKLNIPRKDHLMIMGSCNGLLLLAQLTKPSMFTYINNPITGEYISLPCITRSRRLLSRALGFGFYTNYKVLFIETYQLPNSELRVDCQIFTIGVDSKWRQLVVNTLIAFFLKGSGTILNGSFHWLMDHDFIFEFLSENSTLFWNSICAFDFVTERFRRIPPPPENVIIKGKELSLGELKGKLCVFNTSKIDQRIEIWTMNEYENANSWTKSHMLLLSWIPSCHFRCVHLPIASWRDGEILMPSCSRPQLISFNLREQKAEIFYINGFEGIGRVYAELTYFVPNFLRLKDALKGEASSKDKYPKIVNVQRV